MNKDDLLLSEAYSQIYQEGIWDRLKGQAAGIGAGLKQGVQNVAGKVAGATGAEVKTSGKTMGGAYKNAQQTSLLKSFIKKAQKEVDDFNNDMKKMGAGDIQTVATTHPEIAQQMQQVQDLIAYLSPIADGQAPSQEQQQNVASPEQQQEEEQSDNTNQQLAKRPDETLTTTPQAGAAKPFNQSSYSTSSTYTPPQKPIQGQIVDQGLPKQEEAPEQDSQQLALKAPKSEIGDTVTIGNDVFKKEGTGWSLKGKLVKKDPNVSPNQQQVESEFLRQRNQQAGATNESVRYPTLLEHWYNIITDLN